MNRFFFFALFILVTVTGCAGNYQHVPRQKSPSQKMWELGQVLLEQDRAMSLQCSSVDIAPLAPPGCKNVCINGRWAEVCG